MSAAASIPDLVPVLSRGRHRSPRKGACFMEMASYLAGEKWSDHPACTHPLLAHLARMVNDTVTDETRCRLAPMIPDVVGLTSSDPRASARIALCAAVEALPIAPATRQSVLAVGALSAERVLAHLECRDEDDLTPGTAAALATVPDAERWARKFGRQTRIPDRLFVRRTAPHLVGYAVEGIAVACVPDAQDRLVRLLASAIDVARRFADPVPAVALPTELPAGVRAQGVRG